MHKRLITTAVGIAVAALVVSGCGGGNDSAKKTTTSAATTTSEASSTTAGKTALAAYCAESEKIGPLLLVSGLVGAFGSAASGTNKQNAQTAEGAIPLLFSQQFEQYFTLLAGVAPSALSAEATKIAKVYATGPARLKKVGFTDAEIKQLANTDIAKAAQTDPAKSGANINEEVFKTESAAFSQELQTVFSSAPADIEKEFDAVSAQCSDLATGGVKPCEVLTSDEITAALGVEAKAGGTEPALGGGSGCLWNAGGDEDSKRRVGLVIAGPSQFEQTKSNYAQSSITTTPVEGVGKEAFFISGFTSPSSFSTGGRTIVVNTGTKTLIVSVQRDQDPVEDATLTSLADEAVANLK